MTDHAMQGKLLVVVELGSDPSDPGAVHHGFQPAAEGVGVDDRLTHLEVIRQVGAGLRRQGLRLRQPGRQAAATAATAPHLHHPCLLVCWPALGQPHQPPVARLQGKWLGFRSAVSGDRFLQARKRSPNRLVFFSQNVGTWEQWELGPGAPDPDAANWSSLALTLRHRRLPQFELAVEVVRVGTVSQPHTGAVTPRSLAAGSETAASAGSSGGGGGVDEDPTLERRELKRMSGVLVHVSPGWAGDVGGMYERGPAAWGGQEVGERLFEALPAASWPCSGCSNSLAPSPIPACLLITSFPSWVGCPSTAGVAALCGSREGCAAGH